MRVALSVVMEQPCRLEHSDVPRCSRPGMLEHVGDLAGRHRSALEVQREQNPPARRVGERSEHRLVRIHPSLRLPSRLASRHAHTYLAHWLSIVQRNLAHRLNINQGRLEMTPRMSSESGRNPTSSCVEYLFMNNYLSLGPPIDTMLDRLYAQ